MAETGGFTNPVDIVEQAPSGVRIGCVLRQHGTEVTVTGGDPEEVADTYTLMVGLVAHVPGYNTKTPSEVGRASQIAKFKALRAAKKAGQ